MSKCFSLAAIQDSCFRRSFTRAGLRSSTTDLGNSTIMHCWVPSTQHPTKPTLVLLHGFGANAIWQFSHLLPGLIPKFNLYVPDLLFFGDSSTARSDRSEAFQAQCVMGVMEAHNVMVMDLLGVSYGGFVAYSMAAQYKERVARVVLAGSGVSFEEKDAEEGKMWVKTLDEAFALLLPQSPEMIREGLRLSFHKPPWILPSCLLDDFIEVMCTEYREEKKELIQALFKGRKLSDLPKITQSTLLIWGEYDRIFPLELAHRLQRHNGENVQSVVIKNAAHAVHAERPKEFYKHIKSFLIDTLPPSKQVNHSNDLKADSNPCRGIIKSVQEH